MMHTMSKPNVTNFKRGVKVTWREVVAPPRMIAATDPPTDQLMMHE